MTQSKIVRTRSTRHSMSAAFVLGIAAGIVTPDVLTGTALAQGPSFTSFNVPDRFYALEVSPNGRYMAGRIGGSIGDHLTRYDRWTGQRIDLLVVGSYFPTAVMDNGVVYGTRSQGIVNTGRGFRWTPETGVLYIIPRNTNTNWRDTLERVSADGMWGMGLSNEANGAPATPILFDLTLDPPFRVDLDAGIGGSSGFAAGITLPLAGGARLAYGNIAANNNITGASWVMANAFPSPQLPEFLDVSPFGDRLLCKIGGTYFVRGDGADRVLDPPLWPVFTSNPRAIRMSWDGSVVVGDVAPSDRPAQLETREATVWRKGRTPETLRSMMINAGTSMPTWRGCFPQGVSADGSVVVGYYGMPEPNIFDIRGFIAVLPAANNTCQTARDVTYGMTIDSTNGATRAGGAGPCAAEGTAPDVWFRFVPITNETVTIDTCGSSFDTTLAVYGGTCASLGSALACNDDANPACTQNIRNSRVSLSVFGGSAYYIRVSGWNGSFGSIQLNITAPARPANDNCAQAINLGPDSGAFWNNANAITDARPNCPGAGTPFNDLWYRTIPTETGRMTYRTCNSSINTVMAVYPGGACGDVNMPAIACVNSNGACGGPGAIITVPCTAGTAQLIRVGGLFGAVGNGQITAKFACDALVLPPYALAVVNHGARAFWRFEDSGSLTAADAIRGDPFTCGNYPGTYSGATTRRRGAQGMALHLNGGGHVWADAFPLARVGDTSLCAQTTLEAWVKTTDPYAGVVMTNRNAPDQTSLTMVVGYNPIGATNTAGKAMYVIDGPGVFFGAISSSRIDDGKWHHIVGVRVPRSFGIYTYYIYVDGLLEGTSNIGGGPLNHNAPGGSNWYIGTGPAWAASDAAFVGSIDEAAIYCRSLTPSEIIGHYSTGRPCVADVDNGSGVGEPDGGVTIEDLLYYLVLFDAGSVQADVDDGSGTGRRDGGVTIEDLLYFMLRFDMGC